MQLASYDLRVGTGCRLNLPKSTNNFVVPSVSTKNFVLKNCGTGSGGFKAGNTCAKGSTAAALAVAMKVTGLDAAALRAALDGRDKPLGSPEVAAVRAKVTDAILVADMAVHDAVLGAIPDAGENSGLVAKLTAGNVPKAQQEYAETPVYDLQSLSKVEVKGTPVTGQAVCYMAERRLVMGTTSASGDYRHELGHALRSALGGAKGHVGRTETTKAIAKEYDAVQAKVKANPVGLKTKLDHEAYEKAYGVVGRRSLDNWEENFAEHYRLYHREVHRDREAGSGKLLKQYRQRHPGMARIFDAHYTVALLAGGK